ncbi:phosphotransferase [uncultured Brachybacterium sp.]|uniref:phosphotransferase n=1 Tax=uncultured Brachybacterium sp. TaxID=189680 RepID=UPI002615A2E1|nr:phosphotransferase [uncultured Brachybacterium sp.]
MTTTAIPTSPASTPLELLLDHAQLRGAEVLLDPARLSALLDREVILDRVRIKPGASVLVSYRATGIVTGAGTAPGTASRAGSSAVGRDLAEVGWVQLVRSHDKRENILRRAGRTGGEVREHHLPASPASPASPAAPAVAAPPVAAPPAAAEQVPYLLSGGIDSDPRLGAEIHRVLRRHQDVPAPRVLSYNPSRHAVLLLPGTGEVLRVAARPLDDLLQVVTHWRELGLPTLDQRRWRGRRAVLVGERWGDGDLAGLASHPLSMPAATRLGGIIARLHAAEVSGRDLPAARIGGLIPETTEAVADLLPHRAERIERLSTRLREELPADGPQVLIHGDLSPDQVLVSVDETAVPGEGRLPLRVVDLDRSGLGPAGADLGSWLASCLLAGVEEQAAAFLAGYAQHRALPAPEELAAWTARALLAAALDPMRRYGEDWLPTIEQRLALAETVLERPERLPLPHSASGPAQAPSTSLVPARISHQGRFLAVRRAWADDGRGLPLELTDDSPGQNTAPLRAARLDPTTGEVTVFEAGTDPRLPGLSRVLAARSGAVVVSHRPGKRAVVRTRDDDGTVRFVKIVRPGRAARLLSAIDRSEAFTGPFRTATVLAADEDTVTFSELSGRLLHDGLPVAGGTWRRAWRETLEAWSAAVHSSRQRSDAVGLQDHALGAQGAPAQDAGTQDTGAQGTGTHAAEARAAEVHGPEAEAAVLITWGERADAVDPAGAPARSRAIAAAHRELTRLGEVERPALIHRDLHDKQILWSEGEAPALLDVDTATLGDPALDAANLRAHATWRELQGIWSAEQAEVVREEIDRAAAQLEIRPEALAAYESGTIARLACVYAFRPRWRETAQHLAATLVTSPGAEPPTTAELRTGPGPTTGPTTGPTAGPTPVGPSSTPSPAPAGDPTPLGGSATLLERSMSR